MKNDVVLKLDREKSVSQREISLFSLGKYDRDRRKKKWKRSGDAEGRSRKERRPGERISSDIGTPTMQTVTSHGASAAAFARGAAALRILLDLPGSGTTSYWSAILQLIFYKI